MEKPWKRDLDNSYSTSNFTVFRTNAAIMREMDAHKGVRGFARYEMGGVVKLEAKNAPRNPVGNDSNW